MAEAGSEESPLTPRTIKEYEACPAELKAEFLAQLKVKRRAENARINLAYIGPIFGLLVVLSFLGVSAWLINGGHNVAGTFLGVVDIVSLAGVFVLGNPQGIPHRSSREKGAVREAANADQAIQSAPAP
jgi:hypothetical protein